MVLHAILKIHDPHKLIDPCRKKDKERIKSINEYSRYQSLTHGIWRTTYKKEKGIIVANGEIIEPRTDQHEQIITLNENEKNSSQHILNHIF
jgi:hypothetical protein